MVRDGTQHGGVPHAEADGVGDVPGRAVGEVGGARRDVCAALEVGGGRVVGGGGADAVADGFGVGEPFRDVVVDGPVVRAARGAGPAWGRWLARGGLAFGVGGRGEEVCVWRLGVVDLPFTSLPIS